jgi:stalled ribosome alternative rescue factor ArfA
MSEFTLHGPCIMTRASRDCALTALSHSQGFRIRVWNGPSCIMRKASRDCALHWFVALSGVQNGPSCIMCGVLRDCALTTLLHSQGFRIRVWNFVHIDAKLPGSACPLHATLICFSRTSFC